MAKVFKLDEVAAGSFRYFGRELLEEFPDRVPVTLDLPPAQQEAEEEAQAIDPEAIRAAVMAEARAEAEAMVKEAYAKGYERGTQDGREAFEQSIAQSAAALDRAAAAIGTARGAFFESLEPQVVELATLIARRVLSREVRADPELIHRTVRHALEKIADRQRLRVVLNPQDMEAFRTHKLSLLEDFAGVEELEVEADGRVSPGGCEVESELMQVDARLETLLARVLDALSE